MISSADIVRLINERKARGETIAVFVVGSPGVALRGSTGAIEAADFAIDLRGERPTILKDRDTQKETPP